MTLSILAQFVVVLAAIWMGARYSGVGLGLWGAVGLLVLVAVFGVEPTSPPVDVMLIILAVIMAASVMDAAGGIDFLVRIAERIIRANPKYVTIVAPLTTWSFTFLAGTGHIVYPLLPVIYETAHQSGIRPERPMAVATIASQQAITASPVAAATAAMIGLFAEKGITQWGLPQILMICVPATLTGVLAAAIVSMFVGKDLKDDPEYQARLAAGKIPVPKAAGERPPLAPTAKLSALLFLAGVALVVVFGFFPGLRTLPGAKSALAMPIVIEIVMLSVAAIMLLATKDRRRHDSAHADVARRRRRRHRDLRARVARRQLHRRAQGRDRAGDRPLGRGGAVDVRVRPVLRLGAPLQPGGDDARADAARHRARHSAAVPDRDVPLGQRLLLHPDVRLADRGDQLRPVGHDEDRQVRAQSLVHDPGHRGDRGGGGHWTFPRPRDVRSDGRMNDASRWSRPLRGVTVAIAALATAGMAAAQGISPGDLPKEGYKLPGGIEPVLQLRTYYFDQESTSGSQSTAWALGGWIGARTPWWGDFFQAAINFYTSQRLYGPEDEGGTKLLQSDQAAINALGEAFGAVRIAGQTITAYRQLINRPFINPQDNRMFRTRSRPTRCRAPCRTCRTSAVTSRRRSLATP